MNSHLSSVAVPFQPKSVPFQPTSAPFRPATPVKPKSYATTPTRSVRHASVEYGNSRKRLFGMYGTDSQNLSTVTPGHSETSVPDESYHSDSFSSPQYSYQFGFASKNAGSGSLYSGGPQQRSPVYFSQTTSTSPPMVPDQHQVSFSTNGEYFVPLDRQRYRNSPPLPSQTLHENNFSLGSPHYFQEDSNSNKHRQQKLVYKREQVEKRTWATPQKPQYMERRQHNLIRQGDHKDSTSFSFLKQHDEKPPGALLAWERYVDAHKKN